MQKILTGALALLVFGTVTQGMVRGIYERAINPTIQALHGARLVGYNCEGIAGRFYGKEESDFPKCESIELIKEESK